MKKTFFSTFVAFANNLSKTFAVALASAIVAVSCVTDSSVEFSYDVFEEDVVEEGMISISLDVESAIISAGNEEARAYMATRATIVSPNADNEDNTIYDLWVIQFHNSENGGATRVARYISDYTDEKKRKVSIYPGTDQSFLFVANTNKNGIYSRSMTYDEIMAITYPSTATNGALASVNDALVADDDKSKVRFVMSEYVTSKTITDDEVTNNKSQLTASLKRNVSLVAIKYGTVAPVDAVSTSTISVQLYNMPHNNSYVAYNLGLSSGDIYPDTADDVFEDGTAYGFDKSYTEGFDADKDYGYNVAYYYVPVNLRGVENSNTTWSEKFVNAFGNDTYEDAVYYMVGFEFDDSINDPQGKDKYSFSFTDYVGTDETSYELMPNHVYMFSVTFPADLTLEMMEYIVASCSEDRIRMALSSDVASNN